MLVGAGHSATIIFLEGGRRQSPKGMPGGQKGGEEGRLQHKIHPELFARISHSSTAQVTLQSCSFPLGISRDGKNQNQASSLLLLCWWWELFAQLPLMCSCAAQSHSQSPARHVTESSRLGQNVTCEHAKEP